MAWILEGNIKGTPGKSIIGLPGINGRDGRDGKDAVGLPGKDAPRIIDIDIKKTNDDEIYFIFYFDDNTLIETDAVDLPDIEKIIEKVYVVGGGGGQNVQTLIQEDGVPEGSANTLNISDGLNVTVVDNVATISSSLAKAASPGYTWGRMGDVGALTWLLITGSVPSNKAGLPFGLINGDIVEISVANETVSTFEVGIYEHEGDETNLTQLGTVQMTAQRVGNFNVSFSVTQGRQLAARIETGTARNVGVFLTIQGDAP